MNSSIASSIVKRRDERKAKKTPKIPEFLIDPYTGKKIPNTEKITQEMFDMME